MSQPSHSSRTVSPGPGDRKHDDAVEEESHSQELSDDSLSSAEHDSPSTIANGLITGLKDLGLSTAADHLQGQFSLCPSDQALDTHDDIQYLDGFPIWKPFALCDSTDPDGVQFTVLIHPVFNGRFAVPVILATGQDSTISSIAVSLWDTLEIRHCNGVAHGELRSRMPSSA